MSSYVSEGFIYLYPGLRGRDNGYSGSTLIYSGGAPWGVTDLKAAIRYYRYNAASLPGDSDKMFVFGHSGGGAQSAVAGASGDSSLYTPYLEDIGAAMEDADGNTISDAVYGAMCWCPITSLDMADAAYEWNMGQYFSTSTRASTSWTSALSDDLSEAFATYINKLDLTDEDGNSLTLETSSSGIYAEGTYYDYILSVYEESLNNFLSDTSFPATINSTTYKTASAYIAALNSDETWVTYDSSTNTATISSVGDFVTNEKSASKDVPAFDDLDRGQAENNLFGNDDDDYLHFDSTVASLLSSNSGTYDDYGDWDSDYIDAYADDIAGTDSLGNTMQYRVNMYNPMYYISSYYAGYGTANVAPHWRINTGVEQGDTASTVEVNLKLALEHYSGVDSVSFATVWNEGHTQAERTGSATTNFISWVNEYSLAKWHTSSIFGTYYQWDANWVYSEPHGYLYIFDSSTTKSLFIYSYDFGWIWTGADSYPYFYSYNYSAWFYYMEGTSSPRWFYNYKTSAWCSDTSLGFD